MCGQVVKDFLWHSVRDNTALTQALDQGNIVLLFNVGKLLMKAQQLLCGWILPVGRGEALGRAIKQLGIEAEVTFTSA